MRPLTLKQLADIAGIAPNTLSASLARNYVAGVPGYAGQPRKAGCKMTRNEALAVMLFVACQKAGIATQSASEITVLLQKKGWPKWIIGGYNEGKLYYHFGKGIYFPKPHTEPGISLWPEVKITIDCTAIEQRLDAALAELAKAQGGTFKHAKADSRPATSVPRTSARSAITS